VVRASNPPSPRSSCPVPRRNESRCAACLVWVNHRDWLPIHQLRTLQTTLPPNDSGSSHLRFRGALDRGRAGFATTLPTNKTAIAAAIQARAKTFASTSIGTDNSDHHARFKPLFRKLNWRRITTSIIPRRQCGRRHQRRTLINRIARRASKNARGAICTARCIVFRTGTDAWFDHHPDCNIERSRPQLPIDIHFHRHRSTRSREHSALDDNSAKELYNNVKVFGARPLAHTKNKSSVVKIPKSTRQSWRGRNEATTRIVPVLRSFSTDDRHNTETVRDHAYPRIGHS